MVSRQKQMKKEEAAATINAEFTYDAIAYVLSSAVLVRPLPDLIERLLFDLEALRLSTGTGIAPIVISSPSVLTDAQQNLLLDIVAIVFGPKGKAIVVSPPPQQQQPHNTLTVPMPIGLCFKRMRIGGGVLSSKEKVTLSLQHIHQNVDKVFEAKVSRANMKDDNYNNNNNNNNNNSNKIVHIVYDDLSPFNSAVVRRLAQSTLRGTKDATMRRDDETVGMSTTNNNDHHTLLSVLQVTSLPLSRMSILLKNRPGRRVLAAKLKEAQIIVFVGLADDHPMKRVAALLYGSENVNVKRESKSIVSLLPTARFVPRFEREPKVQQCADVLEKSTISRNGRCPYDVISREYCEDPRSTWRRWHAG
eukprot:PhM_4_TR18441/c0_g1_i2/m.72862